MKELMFSVFPSENFVDLGLYQFGYEQCEPAHSFGSLPSVIIFFFTTLSPAPEF